jgi:hypothetical protein
MRRSSRESSIWRRRGTRGDRAGGDRCEKKEKKPALSAGFFGFRACGLAALFGATALFGAAPPLRATAFLGAALPTTALLCSHGNLSIMECGALDRSPGGSARQRRRAKALRPPRHTPPRRRVKSGARYIRPLWCWTLSERAMHDARRIATSESDIDSDICCGSGSRDRRRGKTKGRSNRSAA